MTEFLREYPGLVATASLLSLLMFVGTLVAVPLYLRHIDEDHFTRPTLRPTALRARRPRLAFVARMLKNVLGVVLVLLGLAMLILPGQGVLTMAMGLTLVDFPGRKRLVLAMLRERHVRRAVDRIRTRAGRPALRLDPE